MTQDALSPKCDSLQEVFNTDTDGFDYTEDSLVPPTLETTLQTFVPCEAYIGGFEEQEPKPLTPQEVRDQALQKALAKLAALEVPAKEHIEQYARDQHRRICRPNTIRQTLRIISSFMSFVGSCGKEHLEQIIRGDLTAWIEHDQDQGLKPATVRFRLSTVKAFLRYFEAKEMVLPTVLAKRLKVKVPDSLPRAMDAEDVRRVLSVIDTVRDRAMITVLLRTGMRIGELLNTLVSEINLKERRIEIYEAEKNRIGRVVYLSDDALDALVTWLKRRDPARAYLFYSRGRSTMTYTTARSRFVKCLEKADLLHKGYSLHCLRHTFATELLNAGMSLPCLQQLLGHSSIQMTLRYARLSDKTREEEYFRAMSRIEKEQHDDIH
jgi:site-specific recombinase XerD